MSALSLNELENALNHEEEGCFEKIANTKAKQPVKKQVKKQTREFRSKRRNRHVAND